MKDKGNYIIPVHILRGDPRRPHPYRRRSRGWESQQESAKQKSRLQLNPLGAVAQNPHLLIQIYRRSADLSPTLFRPSNKARF